MKNLFKYDDIKREIFIFSVSGIIVVSFFYVINNIPVIQELLTKIIGILMPFIWAIAIAFLLSSTCKKIERSIPEKLSFKTRRSIAVLLSLILMIAVISIFLLVLVPQIVTSATQLASSMSTYIKEASKFFGDLAIKYGITQDTVSYILSYSQEIMNTVITFMQQNIPQIVGMTYSTITSIGSIVIGVIIASYMLLDKERLFGQFNKLARAFLKDEVTYFIKDVIFISIDKFNNFIVGKLIDSLIIGIICFVSMKIIGIEYAILISFVIGITNVIPVFGPFIGAIPCIFILLIVDPLEALWFSILIVVLQQIDGNIIGPFILGDSMGLSSMWIMFAIIVGGGLFGVPGMFLDVPAFSIIYHLLKEYAEKRIREKEEYIKNSDH